MTQYISQTIIKGVIDEVRCGAVFFGFMYLHLIVRFSYHTNLHLHLLRSVLAWCGVVQFGAVLRFGLDSFGSD
jgi:hypothetical protein